MSNIPEEFIFKNKRKETLIKLPGSIKEQGFNIDKLDECEVYILDITDTIYIDNCNNCKFFIAPVKGSIFLRDSRNCVCSVACRQLRVKNCTDATFFLYSMSDPHIEQSFDMKFAPYNFAYPNQNIDFRKAGFDVNVNRWCKVYDHSGGNGEGHFSLLPPNQFQNCEKKLENYGVPVNPVPIPKQYGGELNEEIIPGSAKPLTAPLTENLQAKPEIAKPSLHEKTEVLDNNKETIFIYYQPLEGFDISEDLNLPNQYNRDELRRQVLMYNDASKEFYPVWAEYYFAIFLAVLGFLVILLIVSLLKMSSEWKAEAFGIFLALILISLIFILVLLIIKLKKTEKTWMATVADIVNQQNSQYFEARNSRISAGLSSLTITIGN